LSRNKGLYLFKEGMDQPWEGFVVESPDKTSMFKTTFGIRVEIDAIACMERTIAE
jgi:hypothetical protein